MASTYVNDLRLNEMATGDGSGTWGTTTNLNLELIAEKFGSGSEALSDASTATITMADGASDAFRSLALTLTGSLSQACTVTLAPNTISNVWMIKNSAGDAVTLTQGTGANVVIPNGFTKVVYSDGAGSGAAVVDVFDDLSIGPNLRVGNAAAEDTSIVFDGNAKDFYVGLDDSADKLVIGEGSTVGTNNILTITDDTVTIGDGAAADTALVFDGNAQDYYIGLDDSADDLIIGLGSTVGTTPIISVDENKDVAIPDGALTITSSDNTTGLTLTSTDADANVGPRFDLKRDSASPAADDTLGQIRWLGEDSGGAALSYAHMATYIDDPTDGAEDGKFEIDVRHAGASRSRLLMDSSATVFNQDSIDVDFRIESNDKTGMFFVDGGNNRVGVGTSSPGEIFEVEDNVDGEVSAKIQNTSTGTSAFAGLYLVGDGNNFRIKNWGDASSSANATEFQSSAGSSHFIFTPAGSEAMRIASDGKVGIGTTSAKEKLNVSGAGVFEGDHATAVNAMNATAGILLHANSPDVFVTATSSGSNNRNMQLRALNSGSANANQLFLEYTGNIGIGTGSPDTYLDIEYSSTTQTKGIHITNSQAGGYGAAITWNSERSDNNSLEIAGRLSVQGENSWAGASTEESCMIFELVNESTLQEHMRLTHRGQLCFNSTSAHSNSTMLHVESGSSSTATPCVYFADTDGSVEGGSTLLELAFNNDDSFSSANYVLFTDEGGTQGEIRGTGDGTVTYDTTSDQRLKDNIRDTDSKWDMINSMQVRDFEWKKSGNTNTAFIAQELHSVYPEAAYEGGEDPKTDPWSVNYGRLTPILTKALQEAMARIESLEAEVNKLKGE